VSLRLLNVTLADEADLVAVRQRTRQIAELLGFDRQDQTRLATAVSEVARNALQYASGGTVAFSLAGRTAPQILTIVVGDKGAGISNIADVLSGAYRSSSGSGLGLVGARRLVDQFAVETTDGQGTMVTLSKVLPRGVPCLLAKDVPGLLDRLEAATPASPLAELQRQNQDLLRVLAALRDRQEELVRLNGELEDTNRGVVALFAELDEKADHLRRADDMKTRFLSNMSHEFRTPLNAIRGLSNLLLDRLDGDLNAEQEKQVRLITRAAGELAELVDDLLDLAKVEAGKIEVRPREFLVANMLGALRGMLRPLWLNSAVALHFEECEAGLTVFADEGKVSQVLRNLISNALKFTERGEVRVSAARVGEGDRVRFTVQDTGIGIAADDQERIFLEFSQVDSPLQRRTRGTGLGLPLSRKLAQLLDGSLLVESEVGVGSTFTLEIPVQFSGTPSGPPEPVMPSALLTNAIPILVVEDSPEMVLLYEKFMTGSPFSVVHAATLARARQVISRRPVAAVILDIVLRGEDAWTFLAEIKNDPNTSRIPTFVVTQVDDSQKAFALGADAFARKPPERRWLLDMLHRHIAALQARRVLLVDNEEASRYLLRRVLEELGWSAAEADHLPGAVELLKTERPSAILVNADLMQSDGDFDVIEAAGRHSGATCPLVLLTSRESSAAPQSSRDRTLLGLLPTSLPRADMRVRLLDLLRDVVPSPAADRTDSDNPTGTAR
jgi:signal transduction histidine kinase/CheY-like chemotaxis protein